MKHFVKNFLAVVTSLGLTALNLSAQKVIPFGNLPLCFETSSSQTDGGVRFVAHGLSSEFLIAPAQATFGLHKAGGQTASCTMQFVGGNTSGQISGDAKLTGKINYLVGNNPSQWRTGVPTFAQVRVENIYPGINVVYYGNQQQLEYDFDLAAGVNPNVIAIRFDGAEKISVNAQGELVVSLNGGEIVQHQPAAYQTVRGQRHEVAASYKMVDAHTAVFAVGNYDHGQPLVIDPILSFSTYFGGNYGEIAHAVAFHNGYIYMVGETLSTAFSNGIPLSTIGVRQTNFQGGTITGDAFVAKFDSSDSHLVYFTYLGGSANDCALGLDVDSFDNAYVTGYTESPDFPTNNAAFSHIAGQLNPKLGFYPVDAFVTKLNFDGSQILYSTYLGGNAADIGNAIKVDTNGYAYIAGYTYSTNFPYTANAEQKTLLCTNSLYVNANAFVAKIVPGNTSLNYYSYFGGTNYDQATGIALDSSNNIYVTGYTASTNFPTTNALPAFKHLNGATNATPAYDAFVSMFSPGFTNLIYSTFLGGTNNDQATGIVADYSGNAYVVGTTVSTNFPYTNALASFGTNSPSFVHTNGTGYMATNAFLTQIKWDGTNTSIGHSVMLGGAGNDIASGVALDVAGNIFVVGSATSTNFPTTANLIGSLRSTNSGSSDVFVLAISADFSSLLYSAYLGGSDNDYGYAIAVETNGNAYVVGQTLSTNFSTFNALQAKRNGTNDTFLTKILFQSLPSLTASNSAPNVLVSWPPTGEATTNFLGLQTNTNLLNTNWVFTAQPPVLTNGEYFYTFPSTNPAQFFRLHQH